MFNSNPILNSKPSSRHAAGLLLALAGALHAGPAAAATFSAVASPPRFELSAKAGDTVRDTVEISNADAEAGNYRLFTNDWKLEPSGSPTFQDELQPGSCRPWVALERRSILLNPNVSRKIRFEIQVPPGTPAGECRFALMIEQDEETLSKAMAGGLPVPIQGRIAVIVYVRIGDAAPKLRLVDVHMADVGGQSAPVARVANDGNAHDRFDGVVEAVDADGKKINFAISQRPILPGETRDLPFSVYLSDAADKPVVKWRAPLQLKGSIESETGAKIPVNVQVR